MADLFFNAVKGKYRFPSERGFLTVEQLFDVDLKTLDKIYGTLCEQKDAKPKKSLLSPREVGDVELDEKIDIVTRVYNYKNALIESRRAAAEKSRDKQKLLDILAKKREEALENLSEEELLKKLQELGEVD